LSLQNLSTMRYYIQSIFTLIIIFCILSNGQSQENKKLITLEEVVKEYKFYPKRVENLRSMADGLHFTTSENYGKAIIKFRYEDGKQVGKILDLGEVKHRDIKRFMGYEFSDDEKKILIYNKRERIYRRSFLADYYVYDIVKEKLEALTEGKVQLATFSPDGNKVAFVRKNNIYVKELKTGKEYPITSDGKFNYIINGAPDWVYEEEFGFNKAFEWSPDSKAIAYLRFDESNVKEFGMTMFAGSYPKLEDNELHTELRSWKYPKAGDDNSIVTVHIFNLKKKKTIQVDIGEETDQYIPRINWIPHDKELCVYRLNRLQNKLDLLLVNCFNSLPSRSKR